MENKNVNQVKAKKLSKLFFILTSAGVLITIIFLCLFLFWNAAENDAYWGENGYYGYNLARLNYEDNFISLSEFKEVEKEYRSLEKIASYFEYAIFISGGITVIFLITGIALKVKEKGGIKIVD